MADQDINEATPPSTQSCAVDSQASQDSVTSKPTILSNARNLIESKTRFEPDDLQPVQETEQLHSYELSVQHWLIAEPTIISITGHFANRLQPQDKMTLSLGKDVEADILPQLQIAAQSLKEALAQPKWTYNKIEPGTLLKHPHKHWLLISCIPCGGSGHVSCSPCHGSGKVTCYGCGGSRTVHCYNCGGTGRQTRQVSRLVPQTNSSTGYTAYITVYDNVSYTCPSCSYGRINCPTCAATGKTTCSSCSGSGKVTCTPCEGSGQVGAAAWVDVDVNPVYSYQLPSETPSDVLEMANEEDVHGLPPISEYFKFNEATIQTSNKPEAVIGTYQGAFRVVRQEVMCEGESAHLVAYGNDLRWWTLDGIIERLLQDDMKALSSAIIESTNEGLFSSKVDQLLDKLKHVAASEINVDIVEAALADKEFTEHKGAVSEEYATNVKNGIQVTLRRIYVRTAKSFAWKTALATLIIGLGTWAFEGVIWAAVSIAIVLLLGYLLHRRSIRKLLTNILPTPEYTQRAMKVASKGSGGQEAALFLTLPSIILALGIGWILPKHPPFGLDGVEQSVSPTSGVTKNTPTTSIDQSLKSKLNETVGSKSLSNAREKQTSDKPQQAQATKTTGSLTNRHADAKLDSHNELHLHMAEKMFDGGFYKNAYDLANQVLAQYPENARALKIANQAKTNMNGTSGQVSATSKYKPEMSNNTASQTNPKLDPSIETPLSIAEDMLSKSKYKVAYHMASQVLDKHPDNTRALSIANRAKAEMDRAQGGN